MTLPNTFTARAALRRISGLAGELLEALAGLARLSQHTVFPLPVLAGLLAASGKRVEREVLVLRSLARMVEGLSTDEAANDDQERPTAALPWVPGPLSRAELEAESSRLQVCLRSALSHVPLRGPHARLRLRVTRTSLRTVSRALGALAVAEARASSKC